MYRSTKTYGAEVGLSCAFRQWRATSHCAQLHGYALGFRFVFEAVALDHRNWVVDFGGLAKLKQALQANFDHVTAVAADDPDISHFQHLSALGIICMRVMENVGCESFARLGFDLAEHILLHEGQSPRCRVVSCEVFEHGANSAIYIGTPDGQ